jgi:flagellar protein FliS
MALANPYSKYQNVKVSTVNRGTLLVMVYDAAIRYLEEAKVKMVERDFSGKGLCIDRAFEALNELRKSLNFEASMELASSLNQLYFFMNKRLSQATLTNDTAAIDDILRLLRGLREAWKEAADKENPGMKKAVQTSA